MFLRHHLDHHRSRPLLHLPSIATLLFFLALLFSLPQHAHSDIVLKKNSVPRFNAASFKPLFMNNSFTPFESPIVVLSFPLPPPQLTQNDVLIDQTLNGSIALIATSLDFFCPQSDPQPGYEMIRSMRRR